MLPALMRNSTDEFSGLALSKLIVPPKSRNVPRTFVRMCRTWKVASEWFLSIV